MSDHANPKSRVVTRTGKPDDPLGQDARDFWACAARMAENALCGRNAEAMREEIRTVKQRLGMTSVRNGVAEPEEQERGPEARLDQIP
jgi:hypothetical protein